MKLRNKKTGEIALFENAVDIHDRLVVSTGNGFVYFNSLADLNEEWEDYEEPKEQWYIDCDGEVYEPVRLNRFDLDRMANIGNLFETKEEAYKAVEKLKAWKRLKDAGFEFKDFSRLNDCACFIRATFDESWSELYDDLNLLFGGKE